jgi:hypothetical protein
MAPRTHVISQQEQDGFFERLMDDASRRRSRVEKLLNEKRAKELEILKSSNIYQRPRSAR